MAEPGNQDSQLEATAVIVQSDESEASRSGIIGCYSRQDDLYQEANSVPRP